MLGMGPGIGIATTPRTAGVARRDELGQVRRKLRFVAHVVAGEARGLRAPRPVGGKWP